ncbi:AbrB/MazE/SpoVT family DNA-binding domain-containing protein [Vulgatibacter sp.]|uniref:AbrB/MazE/SpoVT family DNA-binding domain-containing protein n=1 Tax=Vulgatibacter sp. TaxID=1971226 RepID=UPI003562A579
MVKKLTPVGNSLGIIIDRPILDLLKIDRETALEISTDGEALIIRPTHAPGNGDHVAEAADRAMARHDSAFRKLAK